MTQETQEFASPAEALAHYGVKGMRWGVRNPDGGGSSSPKAPNPVRQVYKDRRQEAASVRKEDKANSRGQSIGQARKETRATGAAAREIIREYRRAPSPAAQKAAAKRYEKEVLAEIKKPEFRATYKKANTMGKGEMAAHALVFGPLALATIPAVRSGRKKMGEAGYELEIDMAHDILKEMKNG
jgi:hypothetical protein